MSPSLSTILLNLHKTCHRMYSNRPFWTIHHHHLFIQRSFNNTWKVEYTNHMHVQKKDNNVQIIFEKQHKFQFFGICLWWALWCGWMAKFGCFVSCIPKKIWFWGVHPIGLSFADLSGLGLVSWWSNCRRGRRWKRITNKILQENQLEDLMVNGTNMDFLDLLPRKELRNGRGTRGNEHSPCNNNPFTDNDKLIAMALITSHMITKDSSPISILQYATIVTIFENDSEYVRFQTSFELLPTIKGNNFNVFTRSGNIKVSHEIKTQEFDNMLNLLVESTKKNQST